MTAQEFTADDARQLSAAGGENVALHSYTTSVINYAARRGCRTATIEATVVIRDVTESEVRWVCGDLKRRGFSAYWKLTGTGYVIEVGW